MIFASYKINYPNVNQKPLMLIEIVPVGIDQNYQDTSVDTFWGFHLQEHIE